MPIHSQQLAWTCDADTLRARSGRSSVVVEKNRSADTVLFIAGACVALAGEVYRQGANTIGVAEAET